MIIFFEKIDKNEIAWESHKQVFAEGFSEPGGSVAEGVVGKIYYPCREDPFTLLLGGWFFRDPGNEERHLSGK